MGLGRLLGAVLGGGPKGFAGETMVAAGAMLALPSATYVRFHDVMLPTPDGTTQIDHVFVSRFGVFVVETKNMAGWIFGSERDRRWTQVLPGGRKIPFQNPLRQNYRHVKAVEVVLEGLKLPPSAVRSVVAFVGDAELKTTLPENVTVGMGFARHVKSFTRVVMSEAAVLAVCDAVATRRIDGSMAARRAHVRGLRSRADPAMAQKCPGCGREMVLRTSRRGRNAGRRFWGCSGFPSCRMTREA
ncbi:MAG: NERD domain-containing protein [Gammaproteobacteria bacterium]|nr:NERD domain-containing protein [Gammaproteobacteria bacterium]